MKILIIEDQQDLAESISTYLKNEGFLCEFAPSYRNAIDKIDSYAYDIIVIDINLPDGSGLNIVKKLKTMSFSGGIIIASAQNKLEDRISGLNLGADDYLVKPYHLAELNARIKSLIRRVNFKGNNTITINEIQVLPEEHEVYVNGKLLDLTKKEYDLMLFLVTNKNRVISKETIAEHLWGDYVDSADSFDFVYAHIKNLKKKLLEKGANDYLQNVYGVGYKFVV